MAGKYILTIDVGTSSTKTAIWDVEGRLCASATGVYSLQRPAPLWAEIDPELWWQAIIDTTAQVLAEASIHPEDVIGIGMDGVGWTLIPVDQNNNALYPAMLWLDRRASAETEWLNSLPQAGQLVSLVANPIDEAYITPKLLWLKKHRPTVFDAAHRFLTSTGYLAAKFTGELSCDYTQAYGFHFFDIANEKWDADAASGIGIPIEKLPPLVAPTVKTL